MTARPRVIAFVGPTLDGREVRRRWGFEVRPPAAQGDVWKALLEGPRALVLIDGVFEAQPSVWHRELLAAMESGVTVFGAASMGALRAVELAPYGMIGVGQIFRWYRDGVLVDDAEVALLHASAEHGFRPLTLPLVNARHAAALARAAKVLTQREARALVDRAGDIFYQDRTWPTVLEAVRRDWSAKTLARWRAWAKDPRAPQAPIEDLKALDAQECLDAAKAFVRGAAALPARSPTPPSSFARRRKLASRMGVPRPGSADERSRDGLRRLLLVGWARSLGLQPSPTEVTAARDRWSASGPSTLQRLGIDVADAARLFEDLALEEKVLSHAAQMLPDGPSPLEGLAWHVWTKRRRS